MAQALIISKEFGHIVTRPAASVAAPHSPGGFEVFAHHRLRYPIDQAD
jgi:hypothetical protein